MRCEKCGKRIIYSFGGMLCDECRQQSPIKAREKKDPPAKSHYRVRRHGKIVYVKRRKVEA